jgi:hypothetical protein
MDSTSLTSEKRELCKVSCFCPYSPMTKLLVPTAVELATVSRTGGKLDYKILDNATVDSVLKELDLAQPPAENA